MDLPTFRSHIKHVDKPTLDAYHDELTAKAKRARDPARRAGYALALDALATESWLRTQDDVEPFDGTDDELLAMLGA